VRSEKKSRKTERGKSTNQEMEKTKSENECEVKKTERGKKKEIIRLMKMKKDKHRNELINRQKCSNHFEKKDWKINEIKEKFRSPSPFSFFSCLFPFSTFVFSTFWLFLSLSLPPPFFFLFRLFHGSPACAGSRLVLANKGERFKVVGHQAGARFLLLAGEVVGAAVKEGPFVMDSKEQIEATLRDCKNSTQKKGKRKKKNKRKKGRSKEASSQSENINF
jgi:hypothetical protein